MFTEGGDADKLGRGTVWNGEIERCLHQNHVFVARSLGAIRPGFLSLYRGTPRGKVIFPKLLKANDESRFHEQYTAEESSAARAAVGWQEEIVARICVIDDRLAWEEEWLCGLNRLRFALMSVLLTGELRAIPDGIVP